MKDFVIILETFIEDERATKTFHNEYWEWFLLAREDPSSELFRQVGLVKGKID